MKKDDLFLENLSMLIHLRINDKRNIILFIGPDQEKNLLLQLHALKYLTHLFMFIAHQQIVALKQRFESVVVTVIFILLF